MDTLPELTDEDERAALRRQRQRLETLLAPPGGSAGAEPRFPPTIADEDLINALAQHLNVGPLERQALLERPGVLSRSQALIDLLEKLMTTR